MRSCTMVESAGGAFIPLQTILNERYEVVEATYCTGNVALQLHNHCVLGYRTDILYGNCRELRLCAIVFSAFERNCMSCGCMRLRCLCKYRQLYLLDLYPTISPVCPCLYAIVLPFFPCLYAIILPISIRNRISYIYTQFYCRFSYVYG